ncbi:MAG: AtpZ/AtpI family protein [Caulobacter sp.]|nr:AtpZ/AtpI family protein [Caulobacter sp.]MDP1964563.1 AtpZ/AtpI family protein [Reyranella sp.]
MPKAVDPREEALRSLDERAKALKARTDRAPSAASEASAVSQAYRILAELLGGLLVGLAAGAIVDVVLGTRPWGLIGGVLVGFALSLFMARRTANRLMAQAKAEEAARTAASESPKDLGER